MSSFSSPGVFLFFRGGASAFAAARPWAAGGAGCRGAGGMLGVFSLELLGTSPELLLHTGLIGIILEVSSTLRSCAKTASAGCCCDSGETVRSRPAIPLRAERGRGHLWYCPFAHDLAGRSPAPW